MNNGYIKIIERYFCYGRMNADLLIDVIVPIIGSRTNHIYPREQMVILIYVYVTIVKHLLVNRTFARCNVLCIIDP